MFSVLGAQSTFLGLKLALPRNRRVHATSYRRPRDQDDQEACPDDQEDCSNNESTCSSRHHNRSRRACSNNPGPATDDPQTRAHNKKRFLHSSQIRPSPACPAPIKLVQIGYRRNHSLPPRLNQRPRPRRKKHRRRRKKERRRSTVDYRRTQIRKRVRNPRQLQRCVSSDLFVGSSQLTLFPPSLDPAEPPMPPLHRVRRNRRRLFFQRVRLGGGVDRRPRVPTLEFDGSTWSFTGWDAAGQSGDGCDGVGFDEACW